MACLQIGVGEILSSTFSQISLKKGQLLGLDRVIVSLHTHSRYIWANPVSAVHNLFCGWGEPYTLLEGGGGAKLMEGRKCSNRFVPMQIHSTNHDFRVVGQRECGSCCIFRAEVAVMEQLCNCLCRANPSTPTLWRTQPFNSVVWAMHWILVICYTSKTG